MTWGGGLARDEYGVALTTKESTTLLRGGHMERTAGCPDSGFAGNE